MCFLSNKLKKKYRGRDLNLRFKSLFDRIVSRIKLLSGFGIRRYESLNADNFKAAGGGIDLECNPPRRKTAHIVSIASNF